MLPSWDQNFLTGHPHRSAAVSMRYWCKLSNGKHKRRTQWVRDYTQELAVGENLPHQHIMVHSVACCFVGPFRQSFIRGENGVFREDTVEVVDAIMRRTCENYKKTTSFLLTNRPSHVNHRPYPSCGLSNFPPAKQCKIVDVRLGNTTSYSLWMTLRHRSSSWISDWSGVSFLPRGTKRSLALLRVELQEIRHTASR